MNIGLPCCEDVCLFLLRKAETCSLVCRLLLWWLCSSMVVLVVLIVEVIVVKVITALFDQGKGGLDYHMQSHVLECARLGPHSNKLWYER